MKLLVFSPSPAARRLFQLLLERNGYACQLSGDADEVMGFLAQKTSALLVDARTSDEDTLLLLGLLRRRFPTLPQLTLHSGQGRLRLSGQERVVSFEEGGGVTAFPSESALRDLVGQLFTEQWLTTFKPLTGRA